MVIYNLIRSIFYMLILLYSVFDKSLRKFFMPRLFQKDKIKSLEKGRYFWIHGASVGEINLTPSIVGDLLRKKKDKNILITVMTDTGMERAKELYKGNERVRLLYFPLDDLSNISAILKRMKLEALIIVETEIWPNLIRECSRRGRVVFVNGRVSDRSFKRYKLIKWYLRSLFKRVDLFLMQSEEDSEKIKNLGALEERVESVGNLKFDISFENYDQYPRFLKEIKGSKKVIVAGSTRPGEEEYLLKAFERLKKEYLLLLVPRHIDRTSKVVELVDEMGYSSTTWTNLEKKVDDSGVEVVVVDKMGVLRMLYSFGDVVFVGGTLVDIGGHSLIEPLYYGRRPLFGPYLQNVRDISKNILEKNLGTLVRDEDELYKGILKYSNDIDEKDLEVEKFLEENKNSSKRCVKRIIDIT